MNSEKSLIIRLAALFCALGLASAVAFAQENSHVRVVRLSFTQGSVAIQEPGSTEWSKAFVNSPLEDGFKVSTSANSYAEAEFENDSTARIGENSLLDFTKLELAPSGAKLNDMALETGYGTFTLSPQDGEQFKIETPSFVVRAMQNSEFRLDVDQGAERVEVFNGLVDVSGSTCQMTLRKDQVLTFNANAQNPCDVTKGIQLDAWDKWVMERQDSLEANLQRQNSPSYGQYAWNESGLYGWNELSNYGNWGFYPGYGWGWSPVGVPYGWGPYTAGAWSWYPGSGMVWISSEPWGWLPYHYGQWIFDPVFGWVWVPGGFSDWSPALVTWYQGPNWIGWAPAGNYNYLTTRRIVAVSTTSFRRGDRVSPITIRRVDPAQGTVIHQPGVLMRNHAPGPLVNPPSFIAREGLGNPGLHNNIRIVGTGQQVAAQRAGVGSSGIVYDTHTGTYVNSGRGPQTGRVIPLGGNAPRTGPSGLKFKEPAPPTGQGSSNLPGLGTRRPIFHNPFGGAQSAPRNSGYRPFMRSAPPSGGNRGFGGGGMRSYHPAPAPHYSPPSGGFHSSPQSSPPPSSSGHSGGNGRGRP